MAQPGTPPMSPAETRRAFRALLLGLFAGLLSERLLPRLGPVEHVPAGNGDVPGSRPRDDTPGHRSPHRPARAREGGPGARSQRSCPASGPGARLRNRRH